MLQVKQRKNTWLLCDTNKHSLLRNEVCSVFLYQMISFTEGRWYDLIHSNWTLKKNTHIASDFGSIRVNSKQIMTWNGNKMCGFRWFDRDTETASTSFLGLASCTGWSSPRYTMSSSSDFWLDVLMLLWWRCRAYLVNKITKKTVIFWV